MASLTPTTPAAAIGHALGAALLFGLSIPAAKLLVAGGDPWLVAGLLYLGAGIGLGLFRGIRRRRGVGAAEAPLAGRDWGWLAPAIALGGGAGPVLLMFGLAVGPAAPAGLLLNLEAPFTAGLAWLLFGEHVGPRVTLGLAATAAGAVVLAWNPAAPLVLDRSALYVAGAALAWALDNNLTRRVSGADATGIASLKGLAAGAVNTAIGLWRGGTLPPPGLAAAAGAVGLVGYGVSLVLFVLALRHLGAARTGTYFATAPFVAALAGVGLLGEPLGPRLGAAAVLMGCGVALQVTERHRHVHPHEALTHDHRHRHDLHHGHAHPPEVAPGEPHVHPHAHPPLWHAHPHFPDTHHRHPHEGTRE